MARKQEKFSDRVRFNWGYWDARNDRENGRPRTLVQGGKPDPREVSAAFDRAYYHGYRLGSYSGETLEETRSSEPAWAEACAASAV